MSTICEEFGRNEYKSYILIDFAKCSYEVKLYFYTHYNNEKHNNDIEINFLISNNSKLKYKMYLIEVRSGKKYSIESLKRFKEKYKARIGECYVIHPRNLCFKEDITCIPPYMTICL